MEPVVKKCGSQNFDCEKVLISAALLHDVFDHKYSNQEEAENGMTEIRNFLKNENFHEKEIDAVIKICENVSYSKEKKGKLEKLDHPVKLLRDIVSDADKLDAIGLSGIERCRMYSKVISHTQNFRFFSQFSTLKFKMIFKASKPDCI